MERQSIDIKTLLERQSTRGHFQRDNQSTRGGTFGETIDKGALSERQSIDKWGTFGETINKGELSER